MMVHQAGCGKSKHRPMKAWGASVIIDLLGGTGSAAVRSGDMGRDPDGTQSRCRPLLWGGSASVAVRTAVACGTPVADPFDATLFIRSRSKKRDPSTLLGVTIRRLSRTTKGNRVSVGRKGGETGTWVRQTLHPNPSSVTLTRATYPSSMPVGTAHIFGPRVRTTEP